MTFVYKFLCGCVFLGHSTLNGIWGSHGGEGEERVRQRSPAMYPEQLGGSEMGRLRIPL